MPSRICAYCERHTQMHELREPHQTRYERSAAAYECGYCQEVNVATFAGARGARSWSDTFHDKDELLKWYPERVVGKDYLDVPEHIAGAANEAHQSHSIGADRGAVQLARSVIEATAKEQGVTSGNLHDKIEALHAKELLRGHVRDAAHEIRHLGNDMAHGDFVLPVDPEEAEETLTLMDEVLDEVFQSPARVRKRQEARKAKKAGGTDSE